MYKYAMSNNLCTKDYSSYVEITQDDDDEHGIPFTDEDLKKLWETKENEVSEMILILSLIHISANIFTTSLTKFKFILNTLSASSLIIFKDSLVIIRLVTIYVMTEQITLAITISIFSPLYV